MGILEENFIEKITELKWKTKVFYVKQRFFSSKQMNNMIPVTIVLQNSSLNRSVTYVL